MRRGAAQRASLHASRAPSRRKRPGAKVTRLRALRKRVTNNNARRLESMLGLEGCVALEELYLSHNGIARLEGLATLTKLKARGCVCV